MSGKRGTPRTEKTEALLDIYASTNLSVEQCAVRVGYPSGSGSPKVLIHQARKKCDPKVVEGDKRRGIAPAKPSKPRLSISRGKVLTIDNAASTVHGTYGQMEIPHRSMLRILGRMATGTTFHVKTLAFETTPMNIETVRVLINTYAEKLEEIGIEIVKVGPTMYRIRACEPYREG